MADIADRKTAERRRLWRASERDAGRCQHPELCLYRQSKCAEKIGPHEVVRTGEFIQIFRATGWNSPQPGPVAVHVTCSMRRMGLAGLDCPLARLCADEVVVPRGLDAVFAGDRDSRTPRSTLMPCACCVLSSNARVCQGWATRTAACEIGLGPFGRAPYVLIVYLVDACTTVNDKKSPAGRDPGLFAYVSSSVDAPHLPVSPGKT